MAPRLPTVGQLTKKCVYPGPLVKSSKGRFAAMARQVTNFQEYQNTCAAGMIGIDPNALSDVLVAFVLLFGSNLRFPNHMEPGSTVEKKNHAVVFIKPHALNNKVEAYVKSHLAKHKILVETREIIPGAEIESKGLIDAHYGLIAERAVTVNPSSWIGQVSGEKLAAFEAKWSKKLDEAVGAAEVVNLAQYMQKYPKKTATDILTQWDTNGSLKLLSGTYVGMLDSGEIVVNAFYGAMRAKFIHPSVSLVLYSVVFKETDLSWKEFREQVIGATNPSDALPGSLRNNILNDYSSLDLKQPPNLQDNGIHASAGPIEAMRERCIWLGNTLQTDSLTKLLTRAGVEMNTIQTLYNNGEVKLKEVSGKAFDLFEDKDTSETITMLQQA